MLCSTRSIKFVLACGLAVASILGSVAHAAPRLAETKTVTIQNFAFDPKDLTINVGDTVTWTNKDTASHTATSASADLKFDSGKLDTNQTFSFTFDKAGSFSYVCSFHPKMMATIVVQEAGAAAKPAQPAQPAQQAQPAADSKAALEADNQAIVNNSITVKEVYADQDGWMVVHVDDNGKPGKVIGQTAVKKGETNNVVVPLTEPVANGAKLWPMLHIDAGTIGTYEFPGPDVPAKDAAGMVVMKDITINAASAAAPAKLPSTGADDPNFTFMLAGAFALLMAGLLLTWTTRRRGMNR